MQVDVLETAIALDEIAPAWAGLAARSSSASVFQTYEWTRTWWDCFGGDKRLAVVVVRDGFNVVGIAPLAVSRWEGFRHLGFLGSGLADFEDVLIGDDADRGRVLAAIASSIASLKSWDFFLTNRMREDSPNLTPMRTAFREVLESEPRIQPFNVAPFVAISERWDQYEASLPKRIRADSRRQRARLEAEQGSIAFRKPGGESEIDKFVGLIVSMHLERRKQVKRDYSLFEQPRMADFFRQLAARTSHAGLLELEALEVDGRPAALHFGLRYKGHFYYLLPVMADEMAKYSPGRLLLLHLLEESFRRGDSEFDMLMGDEGYKAKFATNRRQLMTMALYRRSVAGRAAQAWFSQVRPRLSSSMRTPGFTRWLRRRGVLGRFS